MQTEIALPAEREPTINGTRTGIEVARIAVQLGKAIRCGHCSLGIAIDIVGRRNGHGMYDWTETHDCKIVRHGLSTEHMAAVAAVMS